VDAIGHSLSLDEQWSVRDDRGFTWWGVNAHRKRQRVIVENDSTLVGCQSAWLLSSL